MSWCYIFFSKFQTFVLSFRPVPDPQRKVRLWLDLKLWQLLLLLLWLQFYCFLQLHMYHHKLRKRDAQHGFCNVCLQGKKGWDDGWFKIPEQYNSKKKTKQLLYWWQHEADHINIPILGWYILYILQILHHKVRHMLWTLTCGWASQEEMAATVNNSLYIMIHPCSVLPSSQALTMDQSKAKCFLCKTPKKTWQLTSTSQDLYIALHYSSQYCKLVSTEIL